MTGEHDRFTRLDEASVLKIGGSVITDKSGDQVLDEASFDEALDSIADAHLDGTRLILVHGAGSFGHPQAEKHGLGTGSYEGVYETHDTVSKLNTLVVEGLRERGVDAVPVHPFSCSVRRGDEFSDSEIYLDHVAVMAEEGFLPVLHGDCVVHERKGASIISGDEIAVNLAESFKIDRLGMCTSTGGVLDSQEQVVEKVSQVSDIDVFGAEGTDVTGGIVNKVEELLRLESGGYIFGLNDIHDFLSGQDVGTLVRSDISGGEQ